MLFFAGSGYSKAAIEYAHHMGIALFKYELNGTVHPLNKPAKVIHSRQEAIAAEREQRRQAKVAERAQRAAENNRRRQLAAGRTPLATDARLGPGAEEVPDTGCLAGIGILLSLLLIAISLFNFVRNTWVILAGTSDLTWATPLINLGWAFGFFLAAGSMVSTGRFRWFWPLPYLALVGFFVVLTT